MAMRLHLPLILVAVLPLLNLATAAEDADKAAAYSWELTELPMDPEAVSPAPVGATLPDNLILHDLHGEEQSLADLVADQLTLLVVYRGGWCPFCSTQLSGLAQVQDRIQATGAQVIGLSPDHHQTLAESVAEMELSYQIYSDHSAAVLSRFGLGFALNEKTVERYEGFGVTLVTNPWGQQVLPVPAVYIIDGKGVVRWRHYDPDYRERPDEEALLTALQTVSDESK